MNPPDNSRSVLTLSKDTEGNTAWVIDNYVCDNWIEASEWDCEVLYWQELPDPPGEKGEMELPPCDRLGWGCESCEWIKKCPLV